jgi:cobalt/nickel transport system permease protein
MISEAYAIGNSCLHRLDPRLKIIAATLYAFLVASANRFSTLAAALLISSILLVLTRLPFPALAKRILLVNGFIGLFWLILPWSIDGSPVAAAGSLTLSREGILLAASLTLKSNAILFAFIALVATSSVATIGQAMNRLGFPDKLVQLLLLTYRYIFVLEQEYVRLRRAASIRSFEPGTNFHTYRTFAYLAGMLFVRAAARAERVQQAMRCRGFHGKYRTLHEFALTRHDKIWAAALGVTVLLIGIIEWTTLLRP